MHPLLSGIRILKNEEALSVSSDLVTFFFFFPQLLSEYDCLTKEHESVKVTEGVQRLAAGLEENNPSCSLIICVSAE